MSIETVQMTRIDFRYDIKHPIYMKFRPKVTINIRGNPIKLTFGDQDLYMEARRLSDKLIQSALTDFVWGIATLHSIEYYMRVERPWMFVRIQDKVRIDELVRFGERFNMKIKDVCFYEDEHALHWVMLEEKTE